MVEINILSTKEVEINIIYILKYMFSAYPDRGEKKAVNLPCEINKKDYQAKPPAPLPAI